MPENVIMVKQNTYLSIGKHLYNCEMYGAIEKNKPTSMHTVKETLIHYLYTHHRSMMSKLKQDKVKTKHEINECK